MSAKKFDVYDTTYGDILLKEFFSYLGLNSKEILPLGFEICLDQERNHEEYGFIRGKHIIIHFNLEESLVLKLSNALSRKIFSFMRKQIFIDHLGYNNKLFLENFRIVSIGNHSMLLKFTEEHRLEITELIVKVQKQYEELA